MTTPLRIATCLTLPEVDSDEAPLAEALARAGFDARLVAWDDPAADWDAPIPTIIRSTWNYALALDRFVAWIDRVATAAPLWNPREVIRGNLHKRYLLALRGHGVPVVKTTLVKRDGTADLAPPPTELEEARTAGYVAELGTESESDAGSLAERQARTFATVVSMVDAARVVIKPEVGAGSLGTRVFSRTDPAAVAHLRALTATGPALVQPYLESVEDYGERSLVFIDGALSHAIRKSPRFAGDSERVDGPVPIAADERAVAFAALAALAPYGSLLYARVDLARDAAGQPCVMEVELVEPSLFFTRQPGSADRYATALARRLREY